jgi:hypothetical protein
MKTDPRLRVVRYSTQLGSLRAAGVTLRSETTGEIDDVVIAFRPDGTLIYSAHLSTTDGRYTQDRQSFAEILRRFRLEPRRWVAEPQSTPGRKYSQAGLEIDLPGDWQAVSTSDPWELIFRSAATGAEIAFDVWLPLRDRHYLDSFERFAKRELRWVQGLRDVKWLKVSGLDAVSFSAEDVHPYRGQRVKIETRQTWIGVPDGDTGGTVFRLFMTFAASGPGREADLSAYERMLASMRIDPVKLHQSKSPFWWP